MSSQSDNSFLAMQHRKGLMSYGFADADFLGGVGGGSVLLRHIILFSSCSPARGILFSPDYPVSIRAAICDLEESCSMKFVSTSFPKSLDL